MGVVATAARELMAAGVTGDALLAALERIEDAMSGGHRVDDAMERRREWDREYRRKKRENRVESGGIHLTSTNGILLLEDNNSSKKEKKGAAENVSGGRKRSSKVPLPDDWLPASPISAAATAELAKMRDWAKSNAISKADWEATFRNWLRRAGIDPQPPPPTEVAPTGHYAGFTSEEREAWDAYGRKTRGMNYPRDKSGGWYFPSRWPPDSREAEPADPTIGHREALPGFPRGVA